MTINASDLFVQIGEDLFSLVEAVGSPLVEVVPLAGPGYAGYQPNSFRFKFLDGRTLKGRLFGNARRASTVEYVLQRWCESPEIQAVFPAFVARSGKAHLTDWIEGRPIDDSITTCSILEQCAGLQGRLHGVPVASDAPSPRFESMDAWHAWLEKGLAEMVEAGVLTSTDSRRSVELARLYSPEKYESGFVHCDFCGENIVLRESGTLCVIDNGTISVDAYDYDLARTWYRWPMSEQQRKTYLDGYSRFRSIRDFEENFPFWAIAALVGSATFRLQKHSNGASVPIERLRSLLKSCLSGHRGDRTAIGA